MFFFDLFFYIHLEYEEHGALNKIQLMVYFKISHFLYAFQ